MEGTEPRGYTMSAIKLLTKFDAHKCLKAAYRAAQDQGFTLTPIDDRSTRFTASKGSPVQLSSSPAA